MKNILINIFVYMFDFFSKIFLQTSRVYSFKINTLESTSKEYTLEVLLTVDFCLCAY